MRKEFKVYNGFGITPSKNYVAAGYDFHVPNILTVEQGLKMTEAMIESDRITYVDFLQASNIVAAELKSGNYGLDADKVTEAMVYNVMHLYISVDPLFWVSSEVSESIHEFLEEVLTFDSKGTPGIRVNGQTEHLLINSGIKVALDPQTVGIFFNKSGRGNKGWDVRACVVDEDYSGYVHLSVAFTKGYTSEVIYAGDKLSQMVVLPLVKYETLEEMTEEDYNNLMANSERGSKGFGSSNEKH